MKTTILTRLAEKYTAVYQKKQKISWACFLLAIGAACIVFYAWITYVISRGTMMPVGIGWIILWIVVLVWSFVMGLIFGKPITSYPTNEEIRTEVTRIFGVNHAIIQQTLSANDFTPQIVFGIHHQKGFPNDEEPWSELSPTGTPYPSFEFSMVVEEPDKPDKKIGRYVLEIVDVEGIEKIRIITSWIIKKQSVLIESKNVATLPMQI
ncbi:MAG: hypothetical protein WCJ81_00620 [bacterium]